MIYTRSSAREGFYLLLKFPFFGLEIVMKAEKKDHANCGRYLTFHTPHWFWIRNTQVWCPGKPWKGGGD